MTTLKELDAQATQGEWTAHNMVHAEGRPLTPEELGEYVTNSVKMSDETRFLFVSGEDEKGPLDVCHVGNGPKGPYNAAYITTLVNKHRSGELVEASDVREATIRECAEACEGERLALLENGDLKQAALGASYAKRRVLALLDKETPNE